MNDDQLQTLGAAVRAARGAIDQTEAARLSGLSRTWWIDLERGARAPRPQKLAQALVAVGADIRPVFELVGWDPAPYLDEQERWRAARGLGAEIAPIPADDVDELKQLDADILDELKAIRTELQRLGDAQRRLVERLPVPPPPVTPSPQPAGRATRRVAPVSD